MANFLFDSFSATAVYPTNFGNFDYELSAFHSSNSGQAVIYQASDVVYPPVLTAHEHAYADVGPYRRLQSLIYDIPGEALVIDSINFPNCTPSIDFGFYGPLDILQIYQEQDGFSDLFESGHIAIKDDSFPPPGNGTGSIPDVTQYFKITSLIANRATPLLSTFNLTVNMAVQPGANYINVGTELVTFTGSDLIPRTLLCMFVQPSPIYNASLTFTKVVDFSSYVNREVIMLVLNEPATTTPVYPTNMKKKGTVGLV